MLLLSINYFVDLYGYVHLKIAFLTIVVHNAMSTFRGYCYRVSAATATF